MALNFVHNLIRDVEKMVIQTEDILITNKNGKDIAKDMKAKATIFQRNFKVNFLLEPLYGSIDIFLKMKYQETEVG